MKNLKVLISMMLFLTWGVQISFAQEKKLTAAEKAAIQGHGGAYADKDPRQFIKDKAVLDNLAEWQDLKFGFMVHWGVYSQWGCVESWPMSAERDWGKSKMKVWDECGHDIEKFRQKYWDLNKTFNPTKFDAMKWADLAKTAGMKYFVFTTMHHDGFNMFDSKFSNYKITGQDCPYHTNPNADVTKELFKAFRAKGMKIGAYYSKPSWANNNFWIKGKAAPTRNANYNVKEEPEKWERFVQFTHNQINQLMSDYGKIDILWLDGGWVNPDNLNQGIRMNEIAANGREKQPGLIVVDRTIHGEFENYITPEQKIPGKAIDYPWETCMTMGNGWSYNANKEFKSVQTCINMLVDVVSKGGNFLLNLGASPEGWFHPEAIQQMEEIGDWMDVNGEAIYATKAIAPYKSGKVAFTQSKNGKVNAIYLSDENENMPEKITIENIDVSAVKKVELLGYGKIKEYSVDGNKLIVKIPRNIQKTPPCKYAWSFVLSM